MIRDWTDSLRFEGLSAEGERLFVRLIMKADDYGRFHADPRLVKASCFPLTDNLRTNDLNRWLDELSNRQLILRYEADGRSVLAIPNYGQRLRTSKAKFPEMEGMPEDWAPTRGDLRRLADKCPQPAADCGESRPEEKRREVEEKGSRREEKQNVGSAADTASPLDVFWKSYPQSGRSRSGRVKVEKEWSKIPAAQRPSIDVISDALERFKADKAWTKENGQYVPAADRWIRERRWESAPAPGLSFNGRPGDLIP